MSFSVNFLYYKKDCCHIKQLKQDGGVAVQPTLKEVLKANMLLEETTAKAVREISLKRPCKLVCRRPECGSTDVVKNGTNNDSNRTQRYLCKTCGHGFSDNLGSENRKGTAEMIAFAAGLKKKLSYSEIVERVKAKFHVIIARTTAYNWHSYGVNLIAGMMERVPINVGEEHSTDELHDKVNGESAYTIVVLDMLTRFWLAFETVWQKGDGEAAKVFRKAAKRAGKIPSCLKSDKAQYFAAGYHMAYEAKNKLQKQCIHEQAEHLTTGTTTTPTSPITGTRSDRSQST